MEKKTTKLTVLGRVFEIELTHDKDAVRVFVRGGNDAYGSSVSATVTDPAQLRAMSKGLADAAAKLEADLKALTKESAA